MTMTKVIRNAEGAIINIGPWNFLSREADESGLIIDHNPLPDGAYEDETDIVEGWDGGFYEASDPRRLAPPE